jgi:ABC-type bacteriocin/lantibiotic exporter with double-glycine peptidase domain
MIAHRLQTIATAKNLLYIDTPKRVLTGSKGAPEYEDIMMRLKN